MKKKVVIEISKNQPTIVKMMDGTRVTKTAKTCFANKNFELDENIDDLVKLVNAKKVFSFEKYIDWCMRSKSTAKEVAEGVKWAMQYDGKTVETGFLGNRNVLDAWVIEA